MVISVAVYRKYAITGFSQSEKDCNKKLGRIHGHLAGQILS